MSTKTKVLQLATATLLLLASTAHAADEGLTIDVHRDANCGCCKSWVSYMAAQGFEVIDHVETDMIAVKRGLGVPQRLASCHTATLNEKFIEGHVPAAEVLALSKRNDLLGIAVPGMPAGSPGMEVPGVSHPYAVIAVTASDEEVMASYP